MATFEEWLSEQEEDDVQKLIEDHIAGLKSALESERGERKGLEDQLRDAARQLEAGSETRQELEKLANDLASSNSKADFYEAAHAAGVKNLSLAYLAAKEGELLGDVDQLKERYPELFTTETNPQGNAGRSRQKEDDVNPKDSMDDIIRKTAGIVE